MEDHDMDKKVAFDESIVPHGGVNLPRTPGWGPLEDDARTFFLPAETDDVLFLPSVRSMRRVHRS